MKIAIFLSTYNGSQYLNAQLESIATQTLINNIHLYVRDDGSSDNTIDIINSYKSKINITLSKADNKGPAQSFWELFTNASIVADYYAFCDQDDIWDNDKLEKAINHLSSVQENALWCSNCRLIDSSNNIIKKQFNEETPEFSIPAQLVCGTTQGCAMVFNNPLREYILSKEVSVFPMHDFVVITYAIASGTVLYDPLPSFSYRTHKDNVVSKGGKSIIKQIKTTYSFWFSKKHRHEVSDFAKTIYHDNFDLLDVETRNFINLLCCSRKNILSRFQLIVSPLCTAIDKRGLRSFKIRVLLGII